MILTLARKFEAVQSTTVTSSSTMPTACLQRLVLLPRDQALSMLAGDIIGDDCTEELSTVRDALRGARELSASGIAAG